MKLKIKANTFFIQRYLTVEDRRVTFCESALLGGKRQFSFGEIHCVLMSQDNQLSFQVRQEVFTLPVNPNKPQHRQAIDALVQGVRKSALASVAGLRLPT